MPRKRGKGKRKGKRKGRRKGRKGTTRRGPISYTPCRDSRGRFARKVACRA